MYNIMLKFIITIILIIITGIGIFHLNENSSSIDILGVTIIYIISTIVSFNFCKNLRKEVSLKGKLDYEQEYIHKLNTKFYHYNPHSFDSNLNSNIYYITFEEFKKSLTIIRRLDYIIDIIKIREDFTQYTNLINKQIPLAIKILKVYEKFFDNYFTLRDILTDIPEVILKKEQREYHVIKTKYDISKLLEIIEVNFAKCLINTTDDILAQIDDNLVTDKLLFAMSTNKTNIDDYINSLENSLSILKRMQINSRQKQIIDIIFNMIECTKEISEYLKKSIIEKEPSTHFINYYLPTICKLLKEYIIISDEALKAKIVTTCSRAIVVFEMERNRLSEKQHIDVDAELKVLNGEIDVVTMLKKEK